MDSLSTNSSPFLGLRRETFSCPLCHSLPIPTTYSGPCPTCINVNLYWESLPTDTEQPVDLHFPGPGLVVHSPIYGNHVIASRAIEEGELIIREEALLVSPYGPSDRIPFCLSCHRDIALSAKCPICKWPICGEDCAKNPCHAEFECRIFASKGIKPRLLMNEYFSVEALRCLLLRKNSPRKWARVMDFESHREQRKDCSRAKDILKFISHFLLERCGMGEEFDIETVNHVVGVLSVNMFWAFQDIKRYSSVLFDKVTLFSHDCDPNTTRKLITVPPKLVPNPSAILKDSDILIETGIAIEVRAGRDILPGESITIRYLDVSQPVGERRAELLDLFYFNCTCSKCLEQLLEKELEALSLKDKMNEIIPTPKMEKDVNGNICPNLEGDIPSGL